MGENKTNVERAVQPESRRSDTVYFNAGDDKGDWYLGNAAPEFVIRSIAEKTAAKEGTELKAGDIVEAQVLAVEMIGNPDFKYSFAKMRVNDDKVEVYSDEHTPLYKLIKHEGGYWWAEPASDGDSRYPQTLGQLLAKEPRTGIKLTPTEQYRLRMRIQLVRPSKKASQTIEQKIRQTPRNTVTTLAIPTDKLDKESRRIIALAEKDKDVQAETRTRIPEKPWKVLWAGTPNLIARLEYGCNAEKLGEANMDPGLRKGLFEVNRDIDHGASRRVFLAPVEYDEKVLEKIVKENIKNTLNRYHIMVVCSISPSNSARIVKILQRCGLHIGQGFRMPYILVGKCPEEDDVVKEIKKKGNVYFFGFRASTKEEMVEDLNRVFQKSIGQAYKEEENRYRVLVMGGKFDGEYTGIPGCTISFKRVSADEEGLSQAKEILETQYIGTVIIVKPGLYEKELVSFVRNEHPYVIPLAIRIEAGVAKEYGAIQYDESVYNTREKALKKLARDMEARARSFGSGDEEIKYEDGIDMVYVDSEGAVSKPGAFETSPSF